MCFLCYCYFSLLFFSEGGIVYDINTDIDCEISPYSDLMYNNLKEVLISDDLIMFSTDCWGISAFLWHKYRDISFVDYEVTGLTEDVELNESFSFD